MAEDKLERFNHLSVCPNCGCIDQKGAYRCLGCGTFHSGAHLVEREAPPQLIEVESVSAEPSAYSLGPKGKIMEETFEQSESVRQWSGGSTDFTVEDESVPTELSTDNKIPVPKSEEL